MEPNKCPCGGQPFADTWINYRKDQRVEHFVRCPDCDKLGGVAIDQEGAIDIWNKFFAEEKKG